jgi:ABC-type glycerol-3-phosphate transport system permease component
MRQAHRGLDAKQLWLLLRYLAVLLLVGYALIPLYWVIITAVRPTKELMARSPSWIPGGVSLASFADTWQQIPLAHYMLNTAIVALVTTLISVAIAALSGYALSRIDFRGSTVVFVLILFTQAIPTVIILIPFYQIFTDVGLLNTRVGLAISYVVFAVPFATLLLRGYFKTAYPVELEQAAYIDGCSRVSVLWRIVLPLSLPGLAAAATFICLLSWNEYIWASAIAGDESVRVVSVGLAQFTGQFGGNALLGDYMAAALFITAPLVFLFMALQRFSTTSYGGALLK